MMGTCDAVHTANSIHSPESPATPASDAPESIVFQSIQSLFERQAELVPGAAAVVFENQAFTYRELNVRANQLAHHLRKRGVNPGEIVAIRAERSAELIMAILGILKAGAAYLPIDPAYPEDRQRFMLEDSEAQLLLNQTELPALHHSGSTAQLDLHAGNFNSEPVTNPTPCNSPDDLAYVIYTSGSTGKPKGVQVTQRNLVFSTEARFRFYREPVGSFLLLSSHAFDSSVAGIFWTLCQGGRLVLPHEYLRQTGSELLHLIQQQRVTHLLCLPSLYAVLLETPAALGSLRTVIVAGETCPVSLVRRHHERVPTANLFNEYGPTEATVWSTVHRAEANFGGEKVPIGRPVPGARIYLLDPQLNPVADGLAGEIYVAGPGVARGYLKRPELTAQKFIPDPFNTEPGARLYRTGDLARRLSDGQLEFLGRIDNQIKIRGHRVELEEIEAALKEHAAVQDAVVIARASRKSPPVNGEAERLILERLSQMPPTEADALLASFEQSSPQSPNQPTIGATAPDSEPTSIRREDRSFDISLTINRRDFVRPPRETQRSWLLNRAMDEFAADLRALDHLAKRFVPGAKPKLETFTTDRTQAELDEPEILEDWHRPLMQAMARAVTETHGDVLEIGFGRGIASSFLQECGVRSHTIVECNDSVISRFFKPWREGYAGRDIRLMRGKWQEVIDTLGEFDGIFFQTYPLNEREFADYLSHSIVFAEHFFPIAARHLRPGGAFTYLTHEIDSLSRRHQRLILQHFSSFTCRVERLQLPPDCRDLWWSDSMVVIQASK